ncbi:MAG: MXAN_5187 C-terminal domain-containing protein [Myxococcota bacterium]|jgi:hypothetical protein
MEVYTQRARNRAAVKRARAEADQSAMAELGADTTTDLQMLDVKLKQLRMEYEQYFLGARKRVPQLLRGEVNKVVAYYANAPIRNTALRFLFNNLRARYFTHKRLWDETCRKIEDGTYQRHLFQAELHERERSEKRKKRGAAPEAAAPADASGEDALFEQYVGARSSTGQGAAGITRDKFAALLRQQEDAIRTKFGAAKVNFRVVVEAGRAKLKATPVKG